MTDTEPKTKSSGEELMDEILYGKKSKKTVEVKQTDDEGDLTNEILYGKTTKPVEGSFPSTEGDELMDEILYGKKSKKTPAVAAKEGTEEPKKKGFKREDYFGL